LKELQRFLKYCRGLRKRNSTGNVRPPCTSSDPIRCALGPESPKDVPRSCPHYAGLRLPDMGYAFPNATKTRKNSETRPIPSPVFKCRLPTNPPSSRKSRKAGRFRHARLRVLFRPPQGQAARGAVGTCQGAVAVPHASMRDYQSVRLTAIVSGRCSGKRNINRLLGHIA
jgi:hypothetical protein